MIKENRLMPKHDYRHPVSRDYFLDVPCGAVSCEWNKRKNCSVPSLCKIGDDGKCESYKIKDSIESPKPLDGD